MKLPQIFARWIAITLVALFYVVGLSLPAFSADCPQKRSTPKAPGSAYDKTNPLKSTPENISAGKALYMKEAKPLACVQCHGEEGKGDGKMAKGMTPNPRNFSCQAMMKDIPDGQLFWVIQNGSSGTGMMGYKNLSEEQIWQLVLYIRKISG